MSTAEKTKHASLYIREIPPETKRRFKAHCAKRGKTMTQIIVDFMKSVSERK